MENYTCEECQSFKSEHFCETCQEFLCWLCDKSIHSKGNRRHHFRALLCKSCPNVSSHICQTCCTPTCTSCFHTHSDHYLTPISCIYPTIVYWDLGIISPDKELFFSALEKLKEKYPKLTKVKIFGKKSLFLNEIEGKVNIEYLSTGGDLRGVFIDISLLYQFFGHFLVITDKIENFKPYIQRILGTVEIKKIKVAYWHDYLNEIDIEDVKGSVNPHFDGFDEELQFKVDKVCNWMLNYLKSFAEKGKISLVYSQFQSAAISEVQLSCDQVTELVTYLSEQKLIIVVEKQFTVDLKQKFISLRLNQLSVEVLSWVVNSLKLDEMLPTERAILARLKDTFDYKPSQDQWSEFIDTFKTPHKAAYHQSTFSLFASQDSHFRLKKYRDSSLNTETYLIYPIDENWKAYDKYLKSGDVLNEKTTETWGEFKDFFFTHFSEGNYEENAIPGGRYGCAQFLKHFGSDGLKELSVGKLNYLVQLAIDDDLLRYQKNLLVWSQCLKLGNENDVQGKVRRVEECLKVILNKFKEGISLAQLPGVLSGYIDFHLDLQELGYAKLKDLVLGVDGVKIVKKSNKHQFAVLTKVI